MAHVTQPGSVDTEEAPSQSAKLFGWAVIALALDALGIPPLDSTLDYELTTERCGSS